MKPALRLSRPFWILLLTISLAPLFSLPPLRAGATSPLRQTRASPRPVSGSRAFVNYKDNERVGCRVATEVEAEALKRRSDQPLHIITSERTSRSQNLNAESAGLQIVLRATDQLEDYPTAKAAFLNAAARWESLISTPITVVIDVDFGPTWFGERYEANVLGQTDAQVLGDSSIYSEVRDALVGVAVNSEAGLSNQLPASSVPTDIGSTNYVFASSAQWRALGFISPVADPAAEAGDLGDPPAVGFNNDFPYDFDPSNGVDSNSIDFDSVAVHEIGHVLGFISNTGYRELERSFPVAVSIWDLYRFRPGITSDNFATAQRVLSSGGSQDFFDGSIEVALSTGRPDGTGGDREQASHWKDDRLTGRYIGVMDPTLADGQRDAITDNDLAALRSFGYAVDLDGAAPDAPTITKASFNGKKLKLKGTGFGGEVQVEINGRVVAPPVAMKVNGSGKKLEIKAGQSELNLNSGSNQVQVITGGVRSNAFAFAF